VCIRGLPLGVFDRPARFSNKELSTSGSWRVLFAANRLVVVLARWPTAGWVGVDAVVVGPFTTFVCAVNAVARTAWADRPGRQIWGFLGWARCTGARNDVLYSSLANDTKELANAQPRCRCAGIQPLPEHHWPCAGDYLETLLSACYHRPPVIRLACLE